MRNIFGRFTSKSPFCILFFPWHAVQTSEPLTSLWPRSRRQRRLREPSGDRGFAVGHRNRNVSFLSLTEEGIVRAAEMALLFEPYCSLLWLIIATKEKAEGNTSGLSLFPCNANLQHPLRQIFILLFLCRNNTLWGGFGFFSCNVALHQILCSSYCSFRVTSKHALLPSACSCANLQLGSSAKCRIWVLLRLCIFQLHQFIQDEQTLCLALF